MLHWTFLALSLSFSQALAQNASEAYTPAGAPCADGFQLVRSAGTAANQTLSPEEAAYISARGKEAIPAGWKAYLGNVQATKVALPDYVAAILNGTDKNAPTLGLAVSGGGYRAAIFGAGVLNALDNRNASAQQAGTGGLLQAATYLSGLSGGSWLVTSLAQANFPTMEMLAFGPGEGGNTWGGWNAQFDISAPNSDPTKDELYALSVFNELKGKFTAGYPITLNDMWARLLARHFTNGTSAASFFGANTTHGAGILFSDIANLPAFTGHQAPFPIVLAESLSPKQNVSAAVPGFSIPLTNVIYEFNPYEMGSYDPTLSSFVPMKYLGSRNTSVCVTGYDQAAFVLGTSSELFNNFNTSLPALLNSSVGAVVELINGTFKQPAGIELDTTLYPNPFNAVANFIDADQDYLRLVDGGEDGQVIPIQPLLVKARGVDVILAVDANADTTDNYSAGVSLIVSQARAKLFPESYDFPPVPKNVTTFVEQKLAAQPTFFGCNATTAPLVIYLANGAPPPGAHGVTNTTTGQTQYPTAELQAMLDQTFVVATQGIANASVKADPEWAACLACAVVDRARARSGEARSGVCEGCFARYCWSGVEAAAASPGASGSNKNGAVTLGGDLMWAIAAAVAVGFSAW